MSLIIDMLKEGSRLVLYVRGILDISTINTFEQTLDEINNIEQLVIDLADLEFIDSTGVGAIINAIHLSKERQFKLKLERVNEVIHEIFDTLGVYYILEAMQQDVA
jgi:anti-anti-sigma factor